MVSCHDLTLCTIANYKGVSILLGSHITPELLIVAESSLKDVYKDMEELYGMWKEFLCTLVQMYACVLGKGHHFACILTSLFMYIYSLLTCVEYHNGFVERYSIQYLNLDFFTIILYTSPKSVSMNVHQLRHLVKDCGPIPVLDLSLAMETLSDFFMAPRSWVTRYVKLWWCVNCCALPLLSGCCMYQINLPFCTQS